MKVGIANLPLHEGSCPKWLFSRMKKLSGAISEIIINEYSPQEFLRRLSNPYFFQGFGCVVGFDFHSSGLTTTLTGALKESLNSLNLGLRVAGGKGQTSRKTPQEIENSSLSITKIKKLQYASKISAKVDNSLVQDGYQLYHHSFFFDEKGNYAIIQQGMNQINQYARRYHWLSDHLTSFIEEPHSAICCDQTNTTLNLTSKQSRETRKISLDLIQDNPQHLYKYFQKQTTLTEFLPNFKRLNMTARHWIKEIDLTPQDKAILQKAYELQPQNYEELVSLKGMGPKKIRALALISDLLYGSQASWQDPVKYSFAHGGKDGTPFPVDKNVYDHSLQTLKQALKNAKLGDKEKLDAIRRLKNFLK